jgi:adenylate kinase family enzyme
MKRVAVIGGGGKSTLARALGLPHHDVDSVAFRPDWSRAPTSEVAHTLDSWLEEDEWVIDGLGPFACVQRRLDAADVVVWIDLPLQTHLRRALLRRGGPPRRVTLTSIVRAHRRYLPQFEAALRGHEAKLVRLRSPREVRRFLEDARAER